MSEVELHHGAATDVGLVRAVNEDAFLVAPPVFVVADGMGGHDRGDVASQLVVAEFSRLAEDGYDPTRGPEVISETLRGIRHKIAEFDAGERARGVDHFSAGTTVVVAMLIEEGAESKWLLANVGDSRIYRYTEGHLEQVTVDHSLVQELIEAGALEPDEAAEHPERHVITRALGSVTDAEPDFFIIPLSGAERLMLCSDGVSGLISDDQIAEVLATATDPRDAADRLVAAAVDAGGTDNATAVVIDVVGLAAESSYDSDASRLSLEQKLGALP